MYLKTVKDVERVLLNNSIEVASVENYNSLMSWFEEEEFEDIEIKYHESLAHAIEHFGYDHHSKRDPHGYFFGIFISYLRDIQNEDPSISEFSSDFLDDYCEVDSYYLPNGAMITVRDYR